jgi:hypothetical protein
MLLAAALAATLQASPDNATAGSAITFTLTVSASSGKSAGLHAGSPVSIQFGDNQSGVIVVLASGDSLSGRTVHVYAAPGSYHVQALGAGNFASAGGAVIASTNVTITSPATPSPATPAPKAGGAKLLESTLTWPNGSYQLQLSPGSTVPQPIARVRLSGRGQIVAQWFVDGTPVQTVNGNAASSSPVSFQYTGALPRSGSHTVAFRILSPAQSGLFPATPPPGIGYEFSSVIVPSPIGGFSALHFQGFIVNQIHYTKAGPTYAGRGIGHIADLSFPVQFSGLTVVPDQVLDKLSPGTGAVTAGTATVGNLTAACHAYQAGYGQFGGGIVFQNQVGTFTRYDYRFALMGLQLEPLGTPSTGSLCWAPAGVDTASPTDAGNGFNNAPAINFFNSLQNQLVLGIASVQLDEDGEFEDDITGDNVGAYRWGYTPFDVQPTKAQTLKLRFSNTDKAPHAEFDGTPAVGVMLQQVSLGVSGIVSSCNWSPTGIDANLTINAGQSIYVADPARFELTFSSGVLTLQNSFFLGGSLIGTFAANQNAPPLPGFGSGHRFSAPKSSASQAYGAATQSAQSYNASAQSSSAFQFTGITKGSPPSLNLGTTDPSGGFSGVITAYGDLVATATPTAFSVDHYTINADHASLFVPGGQTSYQPDGGFDLLMGVIAAVGTMWNQIPQLDYSQPTPIVVGNWHNLQNSSLMQIAGQMQQGISQAGIHLNGHVGQIPSGPSQPITATPAFPYPGLYVDRGRMQTPFGSTSSNFADSTQGQGYGFAFTDGGGNSGLFSTSAGINSSYGSFPLSLQVCDVEILNSSVIKINMWGVLQIKAPIAAAVPVVVSQMNDDGTFGTPVIPQNATIALTAWKGTLALNQQTAVGTSSINIPNASLSLQGYSQQPAVQGALLATGTVQNDQLMPIGQLPSARVAGLDFTPLSFGFPSGGNAATMNGNGSIAGWSANQQTLTLTQNGNGFAPPPGYQFGVSQSVGPVDMNANISFSGNAWNGSGKIDSAGFLNASFGLHVDDQSEKGEIGLSVPGGSGNSSSGATSMAGIAGEAQFKRDDGSLQALAFGAQLNLSALSGKAVVLYDTSLNDPIVQQYGGTQQLGARGWDCSQAWCFAGSVKVSIDSDDELSGELDGLFNSGFSLYANGQLKTMLATVGAQAQLSYFDDGEWDMGVSATAPIFTIPFTGDACFWNHSHGAHVDNCLDTGFSMRGVGGYIKVSVSKDLGSILNAEADAGIWAGDQVGVGAHLHAHGAAQIAGVGPSADASLDLSSNPLGLKGTANLYFCACLGSINISVGAGWYDNSGIQLYDAGLGLGGPCGLCDPSNWF